MLNAIAWLVAGLIVGAIARLLVPGRQDIGILGTMALGIVGALAGGAVARAIWGDPGEPFSGTAWPGYITAILGASILLWLVLKLRKSRAPRRSRPNGQGGMSSEVCQRGHGSCPVNMLMRTRACHPAAGPSTRPRRALGGALPAQSKSYSAASTSRCVMLKNPTSRWPPTPVDSKITGSLLPMALPFTP